ncbi:hypothetical protein PoB_000969800 [Plakobranchus ocellatus]|uniref:Uncharacterized protein n=1 Tax=Plakobranchus ocellatus TaxID=259542 RepID=A0AAV3YKX4_9GAST|nr:hypothetical protein PoB_000969800 [Plakobranchus ocellatus]
MVSRIVSRIESLTVSLIVSRIVSLTVSLIVSRIDHDDDDDGGGGGGGDDDDDGGGGGGGGGDDDEDVNKVISSFEAFHHAKAPVAGLEPAIQGSFLAELRADSLATLPPTPQLPWKTQTL